MSMKYSLIKKLRLINTNNLLQIYVYCMFWYQLSYWIRSKFIAFVLRTRRYYIRFYQTYFSNINIGTTNNYPI